MSLYLVIPRPFWENKFGDLLFGKLGSIPFLYNDWGLQECQCSAKDAIITRT